MIPHDPQAEVDLLAAMIRARGDREVGLALVSESDLYVPLHRRVFAAIAALHARGAAVDPTTVAAQASTDGGGVVEVAQVRAIVGTGGSFDAASYAAIVTDLALCRRALAHAEEVRDAAMQRNTARLLDLVNAAPERLAPPTVHVEPGIEAQELAQQDFSQRWLVRDLIERGDRVMVTGREGGGKSTLLRQMAVMLACGLHPFEPDHRITPYRVLIVDLENSAAQVARALRYLLGVAGERYRPGSLWVKCRPQGMDLTLAADVRWLDALVGHHVPDVLVFGPHYKSYRASERRAKSSEEAAELVGAALDELRVKHDLVLLMEAHAPHGEGSDRAGFRPAGSSFWLRWPEVGIGLKPEEVSTRVVHWRGLRDRSRRWPHRLVEGTRWPWVDAGSEGL